MLLEPLVGEGDGAGVAGETEVGVTDGAAVGGAGGGVTAHEGYGLVRTPRWS
jgi:hypothetical protein